MNHQKTAKRRLRFWIILLVSLISLTTFFVMKSFKSLPKPKVSQSFSPGKLLMVDSISPKGRWAVVFQDDGETGYFYALDLREQRAGRPPIQAALLIYNVKDVAAKTEPSVAAIIWSADGQQAGLLIDDYPHAVFDFAAQRGYARTNYPPPGSWTKHDFAWDDKALEFFQ